jgi:hypothetical protein
MKKENLEIIAKATTLNPFSVEALKDKFVQNLRTFFEEKGISYRELAKIMKKAGSSEEFHYTKTISDMLEGKTPLTVTFTNELGCIINSFAYDIRMTDFLPIKKGLTQKQYLGIAQQVWEDMTNPREARGTIEFNLYAHAIGAVA